MKKLFSIIGCGLLFTLLVIIATNRIQSIENNPNAYTETGRAHSIKLK